MSSLNVSSASASAASATQVLTLRFFAFSCCFERSRLSSYGRELPPQYRLTFTRRKWVQPGCWLIQLDRGKWGHRRTQPDRVIFRCWRIPLPTLPVSEDGRH